MEHQHLTTREAAAYLGVGTTSIKRWADEGVLDCVRTVGGHRRFTRNALAKFQHRSAGQDTDLLQRLPLLSEGELNSLELGVVEIDDEGKILSYNSWESRLSGLSRAQVIGRNFFTQVAPCTNNSLVYGSFVEGIRKGVLDWASPYTFTYRMNPTPVQLRLYRHEGTGTNWVLVETG